MGNDQSGAISRRRADKGAAPPSMCVGLLLAAGRGRRFDPTGAAFKLEQEIDGEAIAVRALRALKAGCSRVFAVVRDPASSLARRLEAQGAEVVGVEGDEGMGFSLAKGARTIVERVPEACAVLVMPADMPWVQSDTVQRIASLEAQSEDSIVVPTHGGADGHPVRFPASLLGDLSSLSGDLGARRLLAAHPVLRLALDDDGIIRDVDHPDDLGTGQGPAFRS